jgi:hypothetical protein
MAAESLQLWADDAFLGQKRDGLVPELTAIHLFLNLNCHGLRVIHLTDAVVGGQPELVGLEEGQRPTCIRSPGRPEELAPETGGAQHGRGSGHNRAVLCA